MVTYEVIIKVRNRTPIVYTIRPADDLALQRRLRAFREQYGRQASVHARPVKGFHPADPESVPYTAR